MEPFYELLRRANHEVNSHQEAGVMWCLNSERNGILVKGTVVRGGFLADEMGLGKTTQILGTCLCNAKRRTLIVLPRALLEQWLTIIRETLCHEPIVFHGHHMRGVTAEDLHSAPFVVTTYGMLVESRKRGQTNLLHDVVWERVIFDEAHHLRNKNTANYRGAKRLHANIHWLITGTPVQNKLTDFRNLCAIMGVSGKDLEATKSLILRRTKADAGVVLPPLREHMGSIRWSDTNEAKMAQHYNESGQEGMLAIVRILRARQMCILPSLIDSRNYSTSKMDRVIEQIRMNAQNGRSKLVFCHFRGEIDELKSRLDGMSIASFDGRVNEKDRKTTLSHPFDVLLCQIQTGCEGLNLQQFEEVYFVSPHWNPAVEDQAIARCHRIGQKKAVDVYRFFMNGFDKETSSVEEYIRAVQTGKREIAKELL